MDANDVAITLACFASISSLTIACITAYFNRQAAHKLELIKSQLQKDHTKFDSYHAKQVEVLAEIYKKIKKADADLKILKTANFYSDSNNLNALKIDWADRDHQGSFPVEEIQFAQKNRVSYVKALCKSVFALHTNVEQDELYIDDDLLQLLKEYISPLKNIATNESYLLRNDGFREFLLEPTYESFEKDAPILLEKIKERAKEILK